MSATSIKVLVTAGVLACGLGLSAGAGWVGRAEAQPPDVIQEQRQLLDSLVESKQAQKPDVITFKTAKNEYDLVTASALNPSKFRDLLENYEKRGWEYCGTTPLADPKRQLVWVFRRSVKHTSTADDTVALLERYFAEEQLRAPKLQQPLPDDVVTLKAEIARLNAMLAEVKRAEGARPLEIQFDKASSPLDPGVLASVLADLAQKKFGRGGKCTVSHVNGVVTVFGDKEVIDWANGVVKALAK